jgi:hypothetical protein
MTLVATLVSDSKFATISYEESKRAVVLKFKVAYVPIETFMKVMEQIEAFAKKEKVVKMVFDKSNLTVFHQPSMEWYHTVWKVRMLERGLKTYCKILPNDKLFRESVKIGREKIKKSNPQFDFNKFDIRYCNSLEEALRD